MGSVLVTLGSLLADLLYAVADPRLRLHSPMSA
jgi:ABC-type dipeptide/oligopeptide/nickel transport system permease component